VLMDQTRYSRLANITKMINMKLELREVLEHVTTAISEEIVQCNYVGIYLPQEDGTFRGYVGKPDIINGWTLDTQVIDVEKDLLAREVIETKKTIYIPDTSKDHRPNPLVVDTFKIKSLLVLPISFDQELYGLVYLFDYGTPMNLTKSEIQSVEAYLNMAAVAIRNANILTQKENLISEKQLLLDVTRDLSLCSSIQESLDKCFFYLGKVFEDYKIRIHLFDTYTDKRLRSLELKNGDDWTREAWAVNGKRIINEQSHEKVLEIITKTKKAILIPDVFMDERFNHGVCRNLSIKGLFIIPIVSMGEVLGVIAVIDSKDKGFIHNDSQIRLAQSIVDAWASTISSLLYMKQLENLIEERTKELAVANQKNMDVIESITDGFLALDKAWNIIYLNDHNSLPLNKTPKDVLGKNLWGEFPAIVDKVLYKEFFKVMSERIPVHFETQSAYGDQWYEIVAYPYDEGICSLIKDITEKKKYEKELKRLSGLDLIGQMAAGISHEIRNPMTTVRGFLQILNEDAEIDKYNQYINLMVEEIDRANSIISEFLSMSNIRTSELEKLDLNSIIHDMTPLINIDAFNQSKYIEIYTNDIPELLLNRNEIRQLIINIYRNGLEAMCEGKVLTIRTYKEENCVVLALQDQGDGIRPEVLENMGTPFFTTKEKGTGLGLGVCYAIAARHNAKIDFETGPKGTTFFVRFKY
jgi:nitrogen-specific signal transduction histidine kinase/GAF domain-containing protein